MKRVTGRAWFSAICVSGLLIAGTAAPSAFGTTGTSGPDAAAADDDRRSGPRLAVASGPSASASARISRPSDGLGPNTLKKTDVTLSSYDAGAGRAVLTRQGRDGGGIDVRKGDVIASPPTKAAPAGALVKVRDVRSEGGGKAELRTARAGLVEVLGGAKADGRIPVPSSAWKVDPRIKGLDVTRGAAKNTRGTPAAGTATSDAAKGGKAEGVNAKSSRLHFDFDTELPGSGGGPGEEPGTALDGSLEFTPEVDFSYDGHGSGDPADATASIAVGGDYKAGWRVRGTVEADRAERIPLAEATAHPVVMVGPVPVVVTVKLTLALKVRANGRIQVDVDQDATGSVKVGTRYAKDTGWEPDTHADGETLPGGRAEVSGQGELRTALGPEADVSLYDTVGVVAFFGPYLRAAGQFSETGPGTAGGAWQLFGGLTLESSLYAQLPFAIIGNRPSKRIDFPPVNREWLITEGKLPAGP